MGLDAQFRIEILLGICFVYSKSHFNLWCTVLRHYKRYLDIGLRHFFQEIVAEDTVDGLVEVIFPKI